MIFNYRGNDYSLPAYGGVGELVNAICDRELELHEKENGKYRVGTKLGRTIYRDDQLIGMMDTVEDAKFIVRVLNEKENEGTSGNN